MLNLPGSLAAAMLLVLIPISGVFLTNVHAPATTPVLNDNFNSNLINSTLWQERITGTGPSVAATNQRIEVSLTGTSLNDPTGQVFGGGLSSVCLLRGDFDIQVDFDLLVWPQSSGVRVGLSLQDSPVPIPAVERTGFVPIDFPSLPRELYLTDFGDGVQGASTSDLIGTLRVTRAGATLSGYYLSSGNWILIHSGPAANTGDSHFGLRAWSHNTVFGNQDVKVAYDNFAVNSGQLLCPALRLTPSRGSLGTEVQVHGSGFPTPAYGPNQFLVSFDDMFLGTSNSVNGTFTFTFDVPHAQAGLHAINAIDLSTGVKATASFLVLEPQQESNLVVTMDTGPVYFPGDTATIYALTTLNGVPSALSAVQLHFSITRPNGTSSALTPVSVGTGLYKVSFLIPKTGSTGTYAIIAIASSAGAPQVATLRSFEVKPAWVSTGGPTILSALSLPDSMPNVASIGMIIAGVAVLGLAFLTRKVGEM